MRFLASLSLSALGLLGCDDVLPKAVLPDGHTLCVGEDGGTMPPDMAKPVMQPCKAALGLPGDSLLCVDFNQATIADLTSKGWNFANAIPECWEIANGKLQVKNFSSFMSSCGFLLPALSASDYQKYSSFTLAVLHTVDLNKNQQRALLYLGLDDDARQIATSTGVNPRQRNIYEIAKTALPNGMSNQYQPMFKITSGLAGGAMGWQIESIAVIGNTQ